MKTPADLARLRKQLRDFAREGEGGRMWYENSARAVLALTDGDQQDAERLIRLVAIYSPQNPVRQNMMDALNAFYAWKAGVPAAEFRVRAFGSTLNNTDVKAVDALYRDQPWEGRKTNSFYANLMFELRRMQGLAPDAKLATADMWVARAFGYPNDAMPPGGSAGANKYDFTEEEMRGLADEFGWTVHQVQAAIWTAVKAR